MHTIKNRVIITLTAGILATSTQAALVAQWEFNDASNLGKATIGTDLTWTGSPSFTNGITGGDGAVFSPKETYITANNPIGPNGTNGVPTRSNQYTFLIDFKLPVINPWNPIFSTVNGGGTSQDADYWISTTRGLGVSNQGYVGTKPPDSIQADTWHRLVVSVDQGTVRSTYVDGVFIGNHKVGAVDKRWSMESTFSVFADNSANERSNFFVSNVALFDTALNATEVSALGLPGDPLPGGGGGTADPVADLAITGPIEGGTAMVISWTGEDGFPYGVETNSNLTESWQPFQTNLLGHGETISVTNTIDSDQIFYRVISE